VLFLFIAALSLLVGTAGAVPVAAFTSNVTTGAAPLTVEFTDSSSGSPTGWAWYFGDETYNGTWTNQTALSGSDPGWAERVDHTSVVLPDGSIVIMGGGDTGYLGDVWRSTDNGTTWEEVTTSGPIWSPRQGHTSVALPDGSIVIMGGNSAGLNNNVWRSTDNGATWTEQTAGAEWSARHAHTTVALPDGSIVLMGGSDNSDSLKNDVWLSTNNGTTWTSQTASAEWSARSTHSSVVMPDGSIILMGGYDSGGSKNDVWLSTNNGTTWTNITPSGGNLWPARNRHTSVVMPDGSIILMGGYGTNRLNDAWRSTDNGTTWTNITPSGGNLWPARNRHTSVALPDGSIILMGGSDGGYSYLNDTWRLDTAGSNAQNPTHTYTEPGTYTVALQAYNDDGYNATRKVGYITVTAPVAPTAAFTANRTSGTAPLAIQFNDTSTGSPIVWNWSFGDDTWHNTTDAAARNVTHTYAAAGTYTVSLTASNTEGSDTSTGTDYITVTDPAPTPTVTPTSRPVYSSGGGGGGSTAGPDGSYNVGGDSAVSTVTVTGTGLKTFIITGWKQSSPGSDIPPAPGVVYQYVDLVPARFEEITGANITFSIPAAWLAEHGFIPGEIVMYHYNGTAWEALPTWVVDNSGSTVTFSATTPGFSLFAITGIEDESPVTTPTAAETTVPATAQPTATETTAAPAGDAAPDFPLGTVALIGGVILVLAGAGYLIRRWWIVRQNPALFEKYD